MVVTLTIKQAKEVEINVLRGIKFYSFEKQYLSIVALNGNHAYYRLSTILAVSDTKE
jgi:hypothetical protein